VKKVIESMDMRTLKTVIKLVSAKKLVLSSEELATIMFKIIIALLAFYWTLIVGTAPICSNLLMQES
jgi:hypothetical protein